MTRSLDPATITRMLNDIARGENGRIDELLPLVYEELRRMASGFMKQERAGHTLQATEIVNEVYLKLVGSESLEVANRAHFFAIAANAMRRILIDYARRHNAARRGGGAPRVSLDEGAVMSEERSTLLLALDEALVRLAALDERQAHIVEMRYFAGLTIEETALALDISPATVKREWRMARAWLYREINGTADS